MFSSTPSTLISDQAFGHFYQRHGFFWPKIWPGAFSEGFPFGKGPKPGLEAEVGLPGANWGARGFGKAQAPFWAQVRLRRQGAQKGATVGLGVVETGGGDTSHPQRGCLFFVGAEHTCGGA